MYCKFLKLSNGDNLIVTTDDNCLSFDGKEFIHVMDPVQLKMVKIPRGSYIVETFMMEPWIRIAKDDLFSIPVKNIIIATDLRDGAIEYYQNFLSKAKEMEVTVTSDSVHEMMDEEEDDEETINFEEFLDEILNPEEEQEDGNNGYNGIKRTYH